MLQIILTLVIFVLLIIPIGRYMFHIATGQHTFCDPVFNRIDNGIYRICGINQNEGMGWKKYAPGSGTYQRRHGVYRLPDPAHPVPAGLQPQRHRRHGSPPSPSTPLSPS